MAKGLTDDQKATFRLLTDKFSLSKDDFFKAPQGFIIITRNGIEKIQRGMNLVVHFDVVESLCNVETGHYVIKAIAMRTQTVLNEKGKPETVESYKESFGEASPKNCRNSYPVAMAEKRALSRVVLKSADLYEYGIKGQDEMEQ